MLREQKRTILIGAITLLIFGTACLLYFRHVRHETQLSAAEAEAAHITHPDVIEDKPLPPTSVPAYKGPSVIGFVQTAAGLPVPAAQVRISTFRSAVSFTLGGPNPTDLGGVAAITTEDGRFNIKPESAPNGLLVRSPQGYAVVILPAKLPAVLKVVIEPWGRIEGTAREGANPIPRARLLVANEDRFAKARIALYLRAPVDDKGGFVIEQAPTGALAFNARRLWSRTFENRWYPIQVQPGKTSIVQIGGIGRPVVGKLTPAPLAFNYRRAALYPATQPANVRARIEIEVASDGSFRFEDVPPGYYYYIARCGVSSPDGLEDAGSAEALVTIPTTSDIQSDDPLILRSFDLVCNDAFAAGDAAEPLAGTTADGKTASLSDLHGRYVLLSISNGPDSANSWDELIGARPIFDRFSKDSRLAVFAAYFGDSFQRACKSGIDEEIPWPLVNCGAAIESAPKSYANLPHSLMIIDPQGNVLARNLDSFRALATLNRILNSPPQDPQPSDIRIKVDYVNPDHFPAQAPYTNIPRPSANDAATNAKIVVVDGRLPNINPIHCLNDGKMPPGPDWNDENFRFAPGTLEGRVRFDFAAPISIAQINSYSLHTDARAPQFYQVYGSDGLGPSFDSHPRFGKDPKTCGWTLIANVDTRPQSGPVGGRYAVSISSANGPIGTYKHLLFVMYPPQTEDTSGSTFYSEIDVIQSQPATGK